MTIDELRAKAAQCRRRANLLTGDRYHRELQRAQHLETEACEREACAKPKQPQQHRGVRL